MRMYASAMLRLPGNSGGKRGSAGQPFTIAGNVRWGHHVSSSRACDPHPDCAALGLAIGGGVLRRIAFFRVMYSPPFREIARELGPGIARPCRRAFHLSHVHRTRQVPRSSVDPLEKTPSESVRNASAPKSAPAPSTGGRRRQVDPHSGGIDNANSLQGVSDHRHTP